MDRLARAEKWLLTLSPRTVRVFGLALTFTGFGIGTFTTFGIASAGVPLSLSLVFWGVFGTMAWLEDYSTQTPAVVWSHPPSSHTSR